jgi:peptide deformylase
MILPIVLYPDPRLDTVCTPVMAIDDDIRQLICDMRETMAAAKGAGLAAPQVGQMLRIFVVGLEGEPHVFINPEVVLMGNDCNSVEGCLSLPSQVSRVPRRTVVKVTATNEQGESFEYACAGFMAMVIQHENDHLNGKTIAPYRIEPNEMAG